MELNRKNYFSKEAEEIYLGSTSFKNWDIYHNGCEAKQLAISKEEWQEKENPAFLLGNYVHSWSSGDLQDFLLEHPEMFKKDGSLYAKYSLGDEMINCLKNDPLVEKFRQGDKEKIFTGEIDGVPFKIQVDILNIDKGYFADIKTTKNLSETYWTDGKKATFIEKYDYKLQFALYAEILRQNLNMEEGKYLRPYILAVDKQDIPDHEIIDMGTDFIEAKLAEIKTKLPRIIAVRNGDIEPYSCGKCEYCRSIKKVDRPMSLSEYELELGIV